MENDGVSENEAADVVGICVGIHNGVVDTLPVEVDGLHF